jgi:hypothetical protein
MYIILTMTQENNQGLRGLSGLPGQIGAITTSTLNGVNGNFEISGNLNVEGVATVLTAVPTNNSTQVASTKFVQDAIDAIKLLSGVSFDKLVELVNDVSLKAPLINPTFTGTVSGITAEMVGLENVDDTSDANKPISTAAQGALNTKAPLVNPTFTGIITVNNKKAVVLSDEDLDKLMIIINGN